MLRLSSKSCSDKKQPIQRPHLNRPLTAVQAESSRDEEKTVLKELVPTLAFLNSSSAGLAAFWSSVVRHKAKLMISARKRRAFGTNGMRWLTFSPIGTDSKVLHGSTGAPRLLAASSTPRKLAGGLRVRLEGRIC